MFSKATLRIVSTCLAFFVNVVVGLIKMSAEEKRLMQQRAVGIACAAAAAAYGAPLVADHASVQKDEEAFLAQATQLATLISESQDGQIGVAALDITKPWREQVSATAAPDTMLASLTYSPSDDEESSFIDILSNLSPRQTVQDAETMRVQHYCLSEAIYYEARSEDLTGQLAVAEVIQNRVESEHYPDSICDVVYEGAHRVTGCQFSFTCDGSMSRKPRGDAWARAVEVAGYVMMGLSEKPLTEGATHYHTNYVSPYWRSGLIHTTTIGTHIFYRFPQGREWTTVRQAKAQKMQASIRGFQNVSLTDTDSVSSVEDKDV